MSDQPLIRSRTSAEARSLPELVSAAASRRGEAPLVGECRDGGWRWLSGRDFRDLLRQLALGLDGTGLAAGRQVGVMGRSSSFWLAADLAIQAAGGVTVPLFVDACTDHLGHIIADADLPLILVDGAACVAALTATARAPRLIERDSEAFAELLDGGRTRDAADPARWEALLAARSCDDLATIIYTSGSTGIPKGVELSHANLLYQIDQAVTLFALDGSRDRALSCLPLAHVFERMVSASYLAAGVPIAFVDEIRQLGERLAEIRPTCLTVVPRILEKFHDRIVARTESADTLRRGIGRWALRLARGPRGWLHGLAERLVYRHVRQALGGELRCLIVGGAALHADLEAFYRGIGLPLYQGYGMTEASPVLTVNRPGDDGPGSVGRVLPGTELRFAPDDEILARGPGIMRGYHGTAESSVDAQGWLHTGDLGRLDEEGRLRLIGRKSSVVKCAAGEFVNQEALEGELARHPLVDRAVVVADGRPWVACLFFLDTEALERWAAGHGLPTGEALESSSLRDELSTLVDRVNAATDRWQRIRRFAALAAPLTVEDGLLTATQKPRRRQIIERFADTVATLYEETDHG